MKLHSYDSGKICASKIHGEFFVHTEFSVCTFNQKYGRFHFLCNANNLPQILREFSLCERGVNNLICDHVTGFEKQADLF